MRWPGGPGHAIGAARRAPRAPGERAPGRAARRRKTALARRRGPRAAPRRARAGAGGSRARPARRGRVCGRWRRARRRFRRVGASGAGSAPEIRLRPRDSGGPKSNGLSGRPDLGPYQDIRCTGCVARKPAWWGLLEKSGGSTEQLLDEVRKHQTLTRGAPPVAHVVRRRFGAVGTGRHTPRGSASG